MSKKGSRDETSMIKAIEQADRVLKTVERAVIIIGAIIILFLILWHTGYLAVINPNAIIIIISLIIVLVLVEVLLIERHRHQYR
ncbi:MAG: hypothetical protein OEV21_06400 [Thermoplasmata archaeon]|nr:hypothetical protein [Thermoplasmata archaeon]